MQQMKSQEKERQPHISFAGGANGITSGSAASPQIGAFAELAPPAYTRGPDDTGLPEGVKTKFNQSEAL